MSSNFFNTDTNEFLGSGSIDGTEMEHSALSNVCTTKVHALIYTNRALPEHISIETPYYRSAVPEVAEIIGPCTWTKYTLSTDMLSGNNVVETDLQSYCLPRLGTFHPLTSWLEKQTIAISKSIVKKEPVTRTFLVLEAIKIED